MANITEPIILDSTGQDIATAISAIGATTVGNMSALTSTDKTSLVGAVNEVNSNKQPKTDNSLDTTSKRLFSLMKNGRCLGRSERFQIAVRSVAAILIQFKG